MEICDNPVICDTCYKLLQSAYKFRVICVETEEKIYQYIEKNNLRLGESIDLSNISEKKVDKYEDLIIIEETDIKSETDVSSELEGMPTLHPELDRNEIELQQNSQTCEKQNITNESEISSHNKSQPKLDTSANHNNKSGKCVYLCHVLFK